tara:strand:- start:40370 stop:40576 length:207 start_codon:yes stop_codon:yes gene_type:complete
MQCVSKYIAVDIAIGTQGDGVLFAGDNAAYASLYRQILITINVSLHLRMAPNNGEAWSRTAGWRAWRC